MFDLPEAKRVRRDELASPASSSPPLSPQLLGSSYPPNAGLDKFFSLETFTAPAPEEDESERQGERKEGEKGDVRPEQEFEFRLFRTPVVKEKDGVGGDNDQQIKDKEDGTARTQVQATKIRIRSPTPAGEGGDGSDGRFVVPFRGWRFYFSDPGRMVGDGYVPERGDSATTTKRSEYLDAAVAGEEVLGWKESPWPGCHLPWRVTHIKATTAGKPKQKPKTKQSTTTPNKLLFKDKNIASCLKKKNLGKKRRIILRKALAAQEAAKEADQEKRTRRNREKKVKRRQREREKKATGAGDAGIVNTGEDTRVEGVESHSGSE